MEDKLNSKAYQTVSQRMATEEATCALTMSQSEQAECNSEAMDEDGDRSKPKVTIMETLGEDGNYVANISNVTSVVVGRVGNLFGKGIGGLSTKFGGGTSWF